MAGPPTSSDGQLTFVYTGGGLPYGAAWTLGVEAPGLPADGLWENVYGWWEDHLKVRTPNDYVLQQVRMKRGPVASGPTYVLEINEGGTTGGPGGNPNTALLVQKAVPTVTGRYWGRMYVPTLTDGLLDSTGSLTEANRQSFQSAFNELYTVLDSIGWTPQVYPEDSSDPRLVSGFNVQGRAATQRRRMRR